MSADARCTIAGPVWELKTKEKSQLSPISEIALTFEETYIATPTTTKPNASRVGEFLRLSEICFYFFLYAKICFYN